MNLIVIVLGVVLLLLLKGNNSGTVLEPVGESNVLKTNASVTAYYAQYSTNGQLLITNQPFKAYSAGQAIEGVFEKYVVGGNIKYGLFSLTDVSTGFDEVLFVINQQNLTRQ